MKRDNSNLSHHRLITALMVASLLSMMAGLGLAARRASAAPLDRPRAQINADAYEVNTATSNNTQQTATTWPASTTSLNGTFATITQTAGVATGDDEDWYIATTSLAPNSSLTATLAASVVARLSIFDAAGVGFSSAENANVSQTFPNTTGAAKQIYIRVENRSPTKALGTYTLSFVIGGVAAAATSTPVIPTSSLPDVYEPNNLPTDVLNPPNGRLPTSYILVGSTFQSTQLPNFVITPTSTAGNFNGSTRENGDVDWFFFVGRAGSRYRIAATVSPGTDTEMFIYSDSAALNIANNSDRNGIITENDDFQSANRSSQVEFVGSYTGRYWIKVWNNDQVPRIGAIALAGYNISVLEIASAATTTAAAATAFPQNIDQFEYNGDFDSAVLIAPNTKYPNLNFVPFRPPTRDTVDNDFFRMPIKQGVYYTCETLDLAGGSDTNLIVFNQNAPQNRDSNAIGGNDNISTAELQRGNFASRVIFLAPYTGIVYLLVGDVTPPRAEEATGRTYSLQCTIGVPNTPTPTIDPRGTSTPAPLIVTATEEPPEPTFTPFPTPRPATRLIARAVDNTAAQPTRAPVATPRAITLDVQVFNDLNRNNLLDAGEGIANASVRLNDEPSNTPLSQAYTDGDGRVRFSVTNATPVKVSIPLFGYSTVVDSSTAVVRVALVPNIEYPVKLP
jgi:hypothetical protein